MGKELPNASTGGGGKYGNVNVRTGGGIDGENGTNVDPMYKSAPTPPGGSKYVSSSVTVKARAMGNTGGADQVREENTRPIVKDAKALKAANAPTNRTGSAADKASRASWNEPKNKPNQARAMKYVQDSAKKPGGWSDRNTKRGK